MGLPSNLPLRPIAAASARAMLRKVTAHRIMPVLHMLSPESSCGLFDTCWRVAARGRGRSVTVATRRSAALRGGGSLAVILGVRHVELQSLMESANNSGLRVVRSNDAGVAGGVPVAAGAGRMIVD